MARPALAALLIILPLTLGLRSASHSDRVVDGRRLAIDAATKLAGDGWTVRSRKHRVFPWLIEGTRGECKILVHFASPGGQTHEKFRQLAKPIGTITYMHGGSLSREFPRVLPMLAEHIQHYAWSFGFAVPTAPLLAIARSPTCGEDMPDLGGLEQRLQAPARPARAAAVEEAQT